MTGSLGDRDNGITAARLLLAGVVIVSHSFGVTGHVEPLIIESGAQVSLGYLAVLGFFGLSGYLLARSRERTPVWPFLRNRALRILPGYWLALVFGALAASAGATLVGQQLATSEGLEYIVANAALVPVVETLPPAFDGAPVNGSLWTLGLEALCYGALAIVPLRWLRPVALDLLPALVVVLEVIGGGQVPLFLAFLVGCCAYLFGLPVTPRWAVLAAAIALPGYALHLTAVGHIAVAFAALGLIHLPFRWERDLSYGVYVFAYPIQQLLAVADVTNAVMIIATVATVLPVAWLSWTMVERPALQLRRRPRVLAYGFGKALSVR